MVFILAVDPNLFKYEYDYENRLTRIYISDSDGQNEENKATFVYDALGRRVRKYHAVDEITTTYYYLCGVAKLDFGIFLSNIFLLGRR